MKSFLCILLLVTISGCTFNRFIQKIDSDGNGVIEKYVYYRSGKIEKEEFDKDLNGKIDCRVYYNRHGHVTVVENDTTGNEVFDSRDEYFIDYRVKSFRDYDQDGSMDRSWTTYYTPDGRKSYIEYDINNDGKVDSIFKLLSGIRENRIDDKWLRDCKQDQRHGVIIDDMWCETVFENGAWKVLA